MSIKAKVIVALLVLTSLIIVTFHQRVYSSLLSISPPTVSDKIIVANLKLNILRSNKTTVHPIYNEDKQELGKLYVLRNPKEGQQFAPDKTYVNILVKIEKDNLDSNNNYIVWLKSQDENPSYVNIGSLEEKIRYHENVYANILELTSFKLLVEDRIQPGEVEEGISETEINQPHNTILESDYINIR